MPFVINGSTGINLGTQPLQGVLPDANAPSGSVVNVQINSDTTTYAAAPGTGVWVVLGSFGGSYTMSSSANKLLIITQVRVIARVNQGAMQIQYSTDNSNWTTFAGQTNSYFGVPTHGQIYGNDQFGHGIHTSSVLLTPNAGTVYVRARAAVDSTGNIDYNRVDNNAGVGIDGPSYCTFLEVTP